MDEKKNAGHPTNIPPSNCKIPVIGNNSKVHIKEDTNRIIKKC